DRSSPPANTSSISARSRSVGDTLFDTDVGSFLRLAGLRGNLRPTPFTPPQGRDHLGWPDLLSGHRVGAQRWPGAPPLAVGQLLDRVVGAHAASLWRFPCWSGHLVVSLRGLGLLPS